MRVRAVAKLGTFGLGWLAVSIVIIGKVIPIVVKTVRTGRGTLRPFGLGWRAGLFESRWWRWATAVEVGSIDEPVAVVIDAVAASGVWRRKWCRVRARSPGTVRERSLEDVLVPDVLVTRSSGGRTVWVLA